MSALRAEPPQGPSAPEPKATPTTEPKSTPTTAPKTAPTIAPIDSAATVAANNQRVILARGPELLVITADAADTLQATELLRAGQEAITGFQLAREAVVLESAKGVSWAPLPGDSSTSWSPVVAAPLPCRPPGRIALTGDWIACLGPDDVPQIFDVRASPPRPVWSGPAGSPVPDFTQAGAVIVEDGKLWSLSLTNAGSAATSRKQLLSPVRPTHHQVLSPDGKRAVGWFPLAEGESALHVFRLDGRATRRRMMKNAVPVAWSSDSGWLLVQRGHRSCLVRAVGGHYKCWRGFSAVDVSAHGERLLLLQRGEPMTGDKDAWSVKGYRGERGIVPASPESAGDAAAQGEAAGAPVPQHLYVVTTGGVQPARPTLLLQDVAGPAAWW